MILLFDASSLICEISIIQLQFYQCSKYFKVNQLCTCFMYNSDLHFYSFQIFSTSILIQRFENIQQNLRACELIIELCICFKSYLSSFLNVSQSQQVKTCLYGFNSWFKRNQAIFLYHKLYNFSFHFYRFIILTFLVNLENL